MLQAHSSAMPSPSLFSALFATFVLALLPLAAGQSSSSGGFGGDYGSYQGVALSAGDSTAYVTTETDLLASDLLDMSSIHLVATAEQLGLNGTLNRIAIDPVSNTAYITSNLVGGPDFKPTYGYDYQGSVAVVNLYSPMENVVVLQAGPAQYLKGVAYDALRNSVFLGVSGDYMDYTQDGSGPYQFGFGQLFELSVNGSAPPTGPTVSDGDAYDEYREASGVALSPDGSTVYFIVSSFTQPYAFGAAFDFIIARSTDAPDAAYSTNAPATVLAQNTDDPTLAYNGIALSPDGFTLYVAAAEADNNGAGYETGYYGTGVLYCIGLNQSTQTMQVVTTGYSPFVDVAVSADGQTAFVTTGSQLLAVNISAAELPLECLATPLTPSAGSSSSSSSAAVPPPASSSSSAAMPPPDQSSSSSATPPPPVLSSTSAQHSSSSSSAHKSSSSSSKHSSSSSSSSSAAIKRSSSSTSATAVKHSSSSTSAPTTEKHSSSSTSALKHNSSSSSSSAAAHRSSSSSTAAATTKHSSSSSSSIKHSSSSSSTSAAALKHSSSSTSAAAVKHSSSTSAAAVKHSSSSTSAAAVKHSSSSSSAAAVKRSSSSSSAAAVKHSSSSTSAATVRHSSSSTSAPSHSVSSSASPATALTVCSYTIAFGRGESGTTGETITGYLSYNPAHPVHNTAYPAYPAAYLLLSLNGSRVVKFGTYSLTSTIVALTNITAPGAVQSYMGATFTNLFYPAAAVHVDNSGWVFSQTNSTKQTSFVKLVAGANNATATSNLQDQSLTYPPAGHTTRGVQGGFTQLACRSVAQH